MWYQLINNQLWIRLSIQLYVTIDDIDFIGKQMLSLPNTRNMFKMTHHAFKT